MEKVHKPTKTVKKEKPNQSKVADSTRTNGVTQGLSKESHALNLKNGRKEATISKPVKPTKLSSQTVASTTKPVNRASKTEKPQTIRRAKIITNKPESLQKKQKAPITIQKNSKPNAVLDTFHNVTVSSPPLARRSKPEDNKPTTDTTASASSSKRARTNTHTLRPEEVVVLRNESAKKRIESEILAVNPPVNKNPAKESVAFEISFEDSGHVPTTPKAVAAIDDKTPSDVELNYSDDFESYESDFESDSHSAATYSAEPNNDYTESIAADCEESDKSETTDDEPYDEESELTQNPITVIQRDKFADKNFDSGHYDMILRAQENGNEAGFVTQQQQTFDSLDTFSGTVSTEQLDSGISSCRTLTKASDNSLIYYGGYADFLSRPAITARGSELMSKIKFDTLLFSLFELKPISYDTYMQTYGKLNTMQSFTQCKDNCSTSDTQTDDCEMRSKWTQHPPKFDLDTLKRQETFYQSSENCCGEAMENINDSTVRGDKLCCDFKKLIDPSGLHQTRALNSVSRKILNFNQLQTFLATSSNLVLKVLNDMSAKNRVARPLPNSLQSTSAGLSMGYIQLNTKLLSALRVVHIFANSKHNLVITVLESLPEADVYHCDFSNLLMVWSTNDSTKPMRLLSTWSKVCRVEICNDMQDIVVCGLSDGSVAMWDLRETYSFCSKLDGYLTHFAATQSVAPICNEGTAAGKITDLGAVIDIKSFFSRQKVESLSKPNHFHKTIQFASLNDSGIIVMWTLVEVVKSDNYLIAAKEKTKSRNSSKYNERVEYSSPWARVKLVQSAICDLRAHLELDLLKAQSNFDRARHLFEKNIYSDEVLREMNQTAALKGNNQLQGLRFSCIAVGYESIYICTNRNFILICSKSLKPNKFRKVFIDESRFLFPTALKLLTNEDFLAVGLSNGSVMILNCNQKSYYQKRKTTVESTKSSETPPTPFPPEYLDVSLETGKSCAIQNIILSERSSFEQYRDPENAKLFQRPKTAANGQSLTSKRKPFETGVLDQQLLLSGSMLRKHLVQSLELSTDGWRLFALSDGEIRCYDFNVDQEATLEELSSFKTANSKIINIAVAQTSIIQQHLILLTSENDVKMHVLKK